MKEMNGRELFGVLWRAILLLILVGFLISCSPNEEPIPAQEQLLINKWWKHQYESRNDIPQAPVDLQLYFDENGWCTVRESFDFLYPWRLDDNILVLGPSKFEMSVTLTWMTLTYNVQDSTGVVNVVLYFE